MIQYYQNNQIRLNFIFCFILLLALCPCYASARVFNIGPYQEYTEVEDFPFDELMPGDIVKIFYRKKPYKGIFIIRKSGTRKNPILITGVPSKTGRLPIIDGSNAIQSQRDRSKQDGRWVVKIGDKKPGDYVTIKKLHLKNANNSQSYFEIQNVSRSYKDNAAGVFVKYGRKVTISGCIIQSCGNGILSGHWPKVGFLKIEKCKIYDNGNHKNRHSSQEHNVYVGGAKTLIQFNRLSSPHSGHNLKDRGKDTIIRYNWIDGGNNRQIDLVEYKRYKKANAFVYGNVIIQGKSSKNRNIIHWGGETKNGSRSGILFFINNTVIGQSHRTYYFVTRPSDCSIYLKNNIFKGQGIFWNAIGGLNGSHNWFSDTIILPVGKILGDTGKYSGFMNWKNIPFIPLPGSNFYNKGTNNIPLKIQFMPTPNSGRIKRPNDNWIDIGAYEYGK